VNKSHQFVLTLSWVVIVTELISVVIFYREITDWVSHNLWVIVVPFIKLILKQIVTLKLVVVLKSVGVLVWHLSKLAMLKLFKTLGMRYGVFFTQRRWHFARKLKVMFLRRGKQFFRASKHFWMEYSGVERRIIVVAFFPIVLLLFLLGLSFNITRKTMVQKTQESAIFQTMTAASSSTSGLRASIAKLDRWALEKIKMLSR